MISLISAILAMIPLLGIAWILFFGSVTTVDGLFMSLILLVISAVFGGNAVYELRRPKSKLKAVGSMVGNATRSATANAAGELVQRGKIESVEFFEANVGQTNKSLVAFSGEGAAPLLMFEGDLRNALPAGHTVEITFRKAGGYNILTNVLSA